MNMRHPFTQIMDSCDTHQHCFQHVADDVPHLPCGLIEQSSK